VRRTALAVGVLFLSASACNFDSTKSATAAASSTASSDKSQPDQSEALMQTSRDWAKAAASGDIERILSYWADSAIVLEPDQHAHIGKAAIREMVRASLKIPKFSITWGPETAVISKSGDMGYLIEHSRITFADSTGKVHTQFGKMVTIWRKDASGAWKCVVDTWNSSPTENVYPAV
jgi:ketosteroid isomerase-like protein